MLLDKLIRGAGRHPQASCFGPWIFYMHDPDRLWFTHTNWSSEASAFTALGKGCLASEVSDETKSTAYVCGAALFFRASVAQQIGVLDEPFSLVYEESDWCYRARRASFECLMIPAARIWHKVGTSFGSEDSPLRTYFSMRNKLLWAEKNASRFELFRILRSASRRLLPGVGIDWRAGIPVQKALVWACTGFACACSRKLHDPQEVAHRQGVLDYCFAVLAIVRRRSAHWRRRGWMLASQLRTRRIRGTEGGTI